MFIIAVLFSLLVAINLAAFWFWIVGRIAEKQYGAHSRNKRIAHMMPVSDRTVVVERNDGGPDSVRTIQPVAGATAS